LNGGLFTCIKPSAVCDLNIQPRIIEYDSAVIQSLAAANVELAAHTVKATGIIDPSKIAYHFLTCLQQQRYNLLDNLFFTIH
jgi:hypothetical protein